MFITEPDHEFLVPAGLGTSSARRWRMVRLSLQACWFVLTVEVSDGEVRLTRTVCIAWDTDLVDVLESLGDATAIALLCMTPGWCSPTGQWSAREVHEVWVGRTSRGDHAVVLRDERGGEFGDQSRTDPQQALADRRLILRLDSIPDRAKPCDRAVGEPSLVANEPDS